MSLPVLIAIIIGGCYLIGSIPFGLLIGKANKIDIRDHGSGNIGATNVLRTLGKKWGYICFLCDFLKGMLPVLGTKFLTEANIPEAIEYTPAIAMVCTVLGHVFSIFLKFKGGKGIATSAGAVAGIAPYALLASLVLWFIVFKSSGYVSLASILAAVAVPFLSFVENELNLHAPISKYSIGILFLIAFLVILKHKSNIKRLMEGTESSFKKKSEPEQPEADA
jgi:glycerol-3-phosphate acyltransferase PlsY